MKPSIGAGLSLLAMCAFIAQPSESLLILDMMKIVQISFNSFYHTWDLFEEKLHPEQDSPYYQEKIYPEEFNMKDSPAFYLKKEEMSLMAKINEINRKIANIEYKIRAHEDTVMRKLESIPNAIVTEMKVNQVLDIIRDVEALHERFNRYMKTGVTQASKDGKPSLNRATIINFANFVTSHQPSAPLSFLDRIHATIVPHLDSDRLLGTKSFFLVFKDHLNTEEFACDVNQSPQQLLFNMYTTFQLTQLKAYTMVHFSWMLLRLYDQGNFTLESEMLKNNYLQRMSQQALAIKAVMKDCKSDMWACDPREHVEGTTYEKITRFLQGYIVNEVDLNNDNTCRENCAAYNYGKQQGCFKEQFCAQQQPCRGNIVGCKFVDSDMWICQSNHFSDRRYDWIEYENGRTLGQRQKCSRAVKKVDSWWRYLFWHCSYCFCYCDDPQDPKSDRFFSLRPVTVDTSNNKVMTGLRFVKINRIFHLQAQQGELMPHGEINQTTVEWVPIDGFGIKDEGVEVGKDYHMLTWQARALDLDDVKVPAGHVLTGIKLRRIGGHLNLEIMGTAFNYTTGKLTNNGSRSQWVGNDNTDGAFHQPRTPHIMKSPDAPNKSSGLNKVDSQPDTYIEFTSSDADLDVAQTAVPFIDSQPVAPNPSVALVGAGIFHKGRSYSGGYVAPKVFTYNPAENIQDLFPDINEAEF